MNDLEILYGAQMSVDIPLDMSGNKNEYTFNEYAHTPYIDELVIPTEMAIEIKTTVELEFKYNDKVTDQIYDCNTFKMYVKDIETQEYIDPSYLEVTGDSETTIQTEEDHYTFRGAAGDRSVNVVYNGKTSKIKVVVAECGA